MANSNQNLSQALRSKKILNRILLLALAFLIVFVIAYPHVLQHFNSDGKGNIYQYSAYALLVAWVLVLIMYYAWSIYFYNVNLGLTNQDWAEIRLKKERGETANEPTHNPHMTESLGLPPGTIRGTLSLSLMVVGISMTIAYFGMDYSDREHNLMVDNFEFIKTAFLMMIAFYFGNKSLEALTKDKEKTANFSNSESAANSPGKTALSLQDLNIDTMPSPSLSSSEQVSKDVMKAETDDFSDPNAQG